MRPSGTRRPLYMVQAMNCLATIVLSLRDKSDRALGLARSRPGSPHQTSAQVHPAADSSPRGTLASSAESLCEGGNEARSMNEGELFQDLFDLGGDCYSELPFRLGR
jgi:hypothetical protein